MATKKVGTADKTTLNKRETTRIYRDKTGKFTNKRDENNQKEDNNAVKINIVKDSAEKATETGGGERNGVGWWYVSTTTYNTCPVEVPEKIEYRGEQYYSGKTVSKMIADTIIRCAELAAEDESKKNKESPCESNATKSSEPPKNLSREEEIRCMAVKWSKIAANIILGTFCIGFVSTAVLGIYSLIKFFCK